MGFLGKIETLAMSNLPASDTGVRGTVIWVSAGEFEGKDCPHGARIKVVLGNKITREGLNTSVTVTLTNPPKMIGTLPAKTHNKVIEFVQLNLDILLKYWENKISTREMLESIEKV
jgi:hypothetical protein